VALLFLTVSNNTSLTLIPTNVNFPQQSRRKKKRQTTYFCRCLPSSRGLLVSSVEYGIDSVKCCQHNSERNQFRTPTFRMVYNQNTLPTILYIWYQQHPTQINCIWL